MKINAKIKYALQTMVDISLNQSEQGVLQKEISIRQDISNKYLDQIVAGLKSAGLIRNIRGRKSGYVLNRSPKYITVMEIYRAFEGDLNIGERRITANVQNADSNRASTEYWEQLNAHIIEHLDKTTLDEIGNKQARYDSVSNENMYFI